MKINKLSLENFKCFKNLDIEFGKITLLTGANSSGKSSVIYSILGAIQSGEFPFQFSPNGKYIEMGDFQEIAYRHDKNSVIKIGFEIQEDKKINIDTFWELDKIRKLPVLKKIKSAGYFYEIELEKKEKEYYINLAYTMADEPTIFENLTLKDIDRKHTKENYQDVLFFIEQLFVSSDDFINYISSFRLHPERTYYEQTKTDLKVSKFGERYTDQIILWETQKAPEFKQLANILKKLSLVKEIKSKRLDSGRYELRVKTNKNSISASLSDVGFGISQFLPIIVADLQLGNDSTLMVSQPEIHLHPSIQAEFGNYLVSQVNETNKSYIVETHSEYLLNKLRLAVVKGEIDSKDVKVYYLQNDGNETLTHQLEFMKSGQILNAPEDFFKTYMIDVMEIALNAE